MKANSEPLEKSNTKKRKRNATIAARKKWKSDLHKPPTSQELSELYETDVMFHSNLFKLQMEELMGELKSSEAWKNDITQWLENFEDFLKKIPESDTYEIDDLSWLKKSVKIPLIKLPENTSGSFKFVPPSKILVTGSFKLGTACTAKTVVDVAVEIPKSCCHKKDFLNYLYPKKRAMYLTYVAQHCKKAGMKIKFSYAQECHLKPVLRIHVKGESKKQFVVSVTAYPSEKCLKLVRFIPIRNNIRSSWYLGTENDEDTPTPYYNAVVLADLTLSQLDEYLEVEISARNIKDGIILLKVWCIQRGLIGGYGRLSGFFITMFVSYLLRQGKLNSKMSAYQMFRRTLIAFQNEDLMERGISLRTGDSENCPSMEEFCKAYDLVFVDTSGFYNIAYNITKETWIRLQHEARLGIQILDGTSVDSFNALFMNKITFCTKFDYLIHMTGPKTFRICSKRLKLNPLDLGRNFISRVIPKLCGLLRKGLGNRILLVDVAKAPYKEWMISKAPRSPNKGRVTLGILLNPDVPISNLEKGPPANDPKAKEFRAFWGAQSELRRFQDASICEAVYWPAETIEDKRNVFKDILKDIFKRFIGAKQSDCVSITGTELHEMLYLPRELLPSDLLPYGTGEEHNEALLQCFDALSKELRQFKELPLIIASVQGTSPAFRFSEVFPPLSVLHLVKSAIAQIDGQTAKLRHAARVAPSFVPALKAIVHFQGSGKWPNEVEAIRKVKAAFHIKIADLVTSKLSLTAVPFATHTDILKDGYIFRIEVACNKEVSLLKRVQLPDGMVKIKDTKEASNLNMCTQILPKMNSLLHGLHQQHNTYGTACRLAKRWLSSQLKLGYLNDVATELLVAFVYVHPEPFTCPSSPQLGFIRFLHLLAFYDWETNPLIINFHGEMQKNEIEEIQTSFSSNRSTLPPMVIAIPMDRQGTLWTRESPIQVIHDRLRSLAKASIKTLEVQLTKPQDSDFKVIFRPPLNSFDVLIHVRHTQITRLCYAIDIPDKFKIKQHKKYVKRTDEYYPIVDYDPVQKYLEDLRANFSDFALFFYDTYGGDVIAVLWKPDAFVPRDFKTSTLNCRAISEEASTSVAVKIVPNIEAMLEDFSLLGAGIVTNVEKLFDNWKIG